MDIGVLLFGSDILAWYAHIQIQYTHTHTHMPVVPYSGILVFSLTWLCTRIYFSEYNGLGTDSD